MDQYALYVPNGWPQPVYTFADNFVTPQGFELGKKLFFDPRLSRDSSISCASCHRQPDAFSDAGNSVSNGIGGLTGNRNAPALFNLAWHPLFMWDGGVNHLEIQPFAPIANPVEMDETLPGVLAKLQADAGYRQLFAQAFNTDTITTQFMFRAFAQYMGTMISANAAYDEVKSGRRIFAPDEEAGYLVFKRHCQSCHREPLFSDFSFRNNGLPLNPAYTDYGRYGITFNPADSMKFKVPSLRNIQLTAPYMHDGRFATLDEVFEHYASGIVHYNNLDPLLDNGIVLTPVQQKQLTRFLYTLTDHHFVNNPKFEL